MTLKNKLDPNNETDFYKVLADYERVNNTLEERDLFGNLCLLKMVPGPGSSFKPITFSSVIPGINFPWNDLNTASPTLETLNAIRGNEDIIVRRYAGRAINAWYNLGPTDIVGPQRFLSMSSNYYNSLLMFAGSYGDRAWEATMDYINNPSQRNDFVFLIRTREALGYDVDERFPVINIRGTRYYFDKDRWPRDDSFLPFSQQDGSLFTDENAILPTYLSKNYTFSISFSPREIGPETQRKYFQRCL